MLAFEEAVSSSRLYGLALVHKDCHLVEGTLEHTVVPGLVARVMWGGACDVSGSRGCMVYHQLSFLGFTMLVTL